MRTLQPSQPDMTGSDVTAWQKFLIGRGAAITADGDYGPATAQATRDYQASRGLTPDAIVGPTTLSQAVRDGFGGAGNGVMLPGMDASVNCTAFAAQIASAGMNFVVRYYSRVKSKAITRSEALALSSAGVNLAVVYQDVNDNVQFFSAAQGKQNATAALAQASALQQPAGSAIYFAADFDPDPGQVTGPLTDHFRAIHDAFSDASASYRVGVYGSGLLCGQLQSAGLAACTWLSQSSSFRGSASFRSQAHIVQIAPSRTIFSGQLSIDDDIAQVPDFGAFRVR
ncbi:MAG TPA: glycoside hydrolase domain-containing protein [Bryobacteraceae bacterium]|nr:glycoside hydrolase domain-containing protein [Bryobacteraceae bacterium]